MTRLDQWWVTNSPKRRLDRNAGNFCMLLALMLSCLYIILYGPVPNSTLATMPDGLQISMCVCIFVGCGIKMHGALSGSRWYFPKTPLKKAYRWGYTGAPIATMGCFVYGYFILTNTLTIGGLSTPLFGLGISIQAVFYWLESRRISRNEHVLVQNAKAEIADERNTDR